MSRSTADARSTRPPPAGFHDTRPQVLLPSATDPRVLKAFAHPVRFQILDLLEHRAASPSEVAIDVDERLDVVAYHVRHLANAGLISLVHREPRPGAFEHFYTAAGAPTLSDHDWRNTPELVRDVVLAFALSRVGRELAVAVDGGFIRDGAMCAEVLIELDSEGWAAAAERMLVALRQIERLNTKRTTVATNTDRDNEATPAVAVMMLFRDVAHDSRGWAGPHVSLNDERVIKACVNPDRARVLDFLARQDATTATIARATMLPAAVTRYHLSHLAQLGLTASRRERTAGVVECNHSLRVRPRLLESWEPFPESSGTAAPLPRIRESVFRCARGGGFDHAGTHYTRTALRVRATGWRRAGLQLRALERDLRRIAERSNRRNNGAAFVARVVLMLFERSAQAETSNPAAASGSPS